MSSPRATFAPLSDLEHLTRLIMSEAQVSFAKAGRTMGKLAAVTVLGIMLVNSGYFSWCLLPAGVVLLTIAFAWFEAIRVECLGERFFPSKRLNLSLALVLRWQCLAVFAGAIAGGSLAIYRPGSLFMAVLDRSWIFAKVVAVPLFFMLLGRAVQPYNFQSIRAEVQCAEGLVRQLLSAKGGVKATEILPLVKSDCIPVYKLGSVAALLRQVAGDFDAAHKLAVELPVQVGTTGKAAWLSVFFSPFRSFARELFFWEWKDLVLYAVVAVYMALTYAGSFYIPLAPLCLLCPFLGPKSRAAWNVRALQEDIRVAQGKSVEKKGGMTPKPCSDAILAVNWPMLTYLCIVHATAIYALVVQFAFRGTCPLFGEGIAMTPQTFLFAFTLYVASALGITGGVHRLWAHRSYKAGLPLKVLLMVLNSIANQGGIFHWARDHRVHHLYSDTEADPHDARRGFWFSHIGWLIFKKHPAVLEAGAKLNLNDLLTDPVVMFQKRADPFWNLMWCFGFPAFTSLAWGDSLWNGFLVAGVLRYVLLLHATWAVNSVVHCCGTKPYNPAHKTTENGWVSLFAIGEGWHNWHHAFDYDYACAELGALQQFNPTKVFLDCMVFLGLAWDPKRAHNVWETRKARWSKQRGHPVIESIEGPPLFRRRVTTFGPAFDDEDEN